VTEGHSGAPPHPNGPRLSLKHIEEASRTIDPVFRNTPQFVCEPLSKALGTRVLVKVETANPIRSFKGRGADYFVSQLSPQARVITAALEISARPWPMPAADEELR
jgi:threonine dehydratase